MRKTNEQSEVRAKRELAKSVLKALKKGRSGKEMGMRERRIGATDKSG